MAVRCFEEISGHLREIFDPRQVEQLARYIGQYDFDDAKEILEHLIAQQQPT